MGTTAGTKYAVVIGDIVGSRKQPDQRSLIKHLTATLGWVNGHIQAVQPLTVTLGDEFQGAYRDLGGAFDAALLVRLRTHGSWRARIGIGWGEITSFDPERQPLAQSGPAWWSAREALKRLSELTTKQMWPRQTLTQFEGAAPPLTSALNGLLLCRDTLLARFDARDARIGLGMFMGESQKEIARQLGIRPPSVARRQADKGLSAVYRAHELLRGAIP